MRGRLGQVLYAKNRIKIACANGPLVTPEDNGRDVRPQLTVRDWVDPELAQVLGDAVGLRLALRLFQFPAFFRESALCHGRPLHGAVRVLKIDVTRVEVG